MPEMSETGTPRGEPGGAPDEHLHDTKLLLRRFRDVEYAVKLSETELDLRFERECGTGLSALELNAELAGVDLSNTRLEEYTRSVVRSRNMLRIIRAALDAVRMEPNNGELLYRILFLNYFSPQKPRNRECVIDQLDRDGFPMSTASYHRYLNLAVGTIDRILWGYTTRDCMEVLRQFVPG